MKSNANKCYYHFSFIISGYLNNLEATAATIDEEGWVHSGDIGYYDDDLHFFVIDRLKELIKYKAYQVSRFFRREIFRFKFVSKSK